MTSSVPSEACGSASTGPIGKLCSCNLGRVQPARLSSPGLLDLNPIQFPGLYHRPHHLSLLVYPTFRLLSPQLCSEPSFHPFLRSLKSLKCSLLPILPKDHKYRDLGCFRGLISVASRLTCQLLLPSITEVQGWALRPPEPCRYIYLDRMKFLL